MEIGLSLTDSELKTIRYYDENAEYYYAQTVGLDLCHLYAPFMTHIPDGGRILDAGCGSGRDSLYFKRHGYSVTAFDASKAMVRFSSELIGQAVLHLTFDEIAFEKEFDGVWACASLLHVPRSKAAETITRLANALKGGGVLYVSLKRSSGQQVMKGRTYTFYDEASLSVLLRNIGTLELIGPWGSQDTRADRGGEEWINVLAKRR